MKLTSKEALRLAAILEPDYPVFATAIREAAQRYTHVILTVT